MIVLRVLVLPYYRVVSELYLGLMVLVLPLYLVVLEFVYLVEDLDALPTSFQPRTLQCDTS